MSKRYVTRNAALFFDDDGNPSMTADTLFEEEDNPRETGLLDQWGNPLYRVSDKIKMGFAV